MAVTHKEMTGSGKAFIGALAVMIVLAAAVPRFLAYGALGLGLIFPALAWFRYKEKTPLHRPTAIISAGIVALAGLSSLWAIDSGEAAERAAKLAAVFLGCMYLVSFARACSYEKIRDSWLIAPAALALSMFLLAIDHSLNFPLYRLVRAIPFREHVGYFELNRSVIVCTLLYIPFMTVLFLKKPPAWKGLVIGTTLLFLPVLYFTESQSAQFALIAMLATLFLFPYRHKVFWYLLGGVIVLVMLFLPWISMWAFAHMAETLSHTPFFSTGTGNAAERLEIWDFVSRYALQRPLYGFGIEATRAVQDFHSQQLFHPVSTVLHPHNFILQIWIEFGAIGIACALAASLYILSQIYRQPVQVQRLWLPLFIAVFVVGSTGYGVWQGWWLGLIFILVALMFLCRTVLLEKGQ